MTSVPRRVEGPDCVACRHPADWHHLTPVPDETLGEVGHYRCIGCGCGDYVGEVNGHEGWWSWVKQKLGWD